MTSTDEITPTRIGTVFRNAFGRTRRLIAFMAVAFVTFAPIFDHWKIALSGVGVLLAIILQVLFEVHDWADKTEAAAPRQFRGIEQAIPIVKQYLQDALDRDGEIHFRWVGMTMANVWITNLEGVMDWLARDVGAKKVKFEVAMSDSAWLDTNKIRKAWDGASADANAQRIIEYLTEDAPQRIPKLEELDWTFEVRRYAHMPTLHGGLINDKYLFLGISRWDAKQMHAGDRLFRLYKEEDGQGSRDKIKVFQGWFDFSFADPKPSWYASCKGPMKAVSKGTARVHN